MQIETLSINTQCRLVWRISDEEIHTLSELGMVHMQEPPGPNDGAVLSEIDRHGAVLRNRYLSIEQANTWMAKYNRTREHKIVIRIPDRFPMCFDLGPETKDRITIIYAEDAERYYHVGGWETGDGVWEHGEISKRDVPDGLSHLGKQVFLTDLTPEVQQRFKNGNY